MNQEVILQMMRATIPRDRALLEAFLYYQADHFDEDWDSLIRQFLTNRQEINKSVQVLHFETDVSAFVQASPYDTAHDLLTYTQVFGQNGLQKLDKLSPSEKDLVIEVAMFNLATRFQLLDSNGHYQTISTASLLEKGKGANLVNVYRVANNLADRISRDIEQFLLTYEPELETRADETVLENEETVDEHKESSNQAISFREEGSLVIASLDVDLSQLDIRTGKTSHLPAYEELSLRRKFEILTYFDQIRNERSKVPSFRRGDFDTEMEMTPVFEGEELLTYLEADGSLYELKRTLTQVEEKELEKIGQAIRVENQEKLTQVGIDLSQFDPDQIGILLDAAGRFHLKNADLALLGGYPNASVTQLALATELLQMGLSHEKIEFFFGSQLSLEELRQVAYAFLHQELSIEDAEQFEKDKGNQPDLTLRDWKNKLEKAEGKEVVDEAFEVNPLVQMVLDNYPLGTLVSYKGQDFEVTSVSDARLNGLIRIELVNDFSDIIEQNPVLYLRTWEEISQVLHIPKPEPKVELDEPDQELNLFSFLEEETSQSVNEAVQNIGVLDPDGSEKGHNDTDLEDTDNQIPEEEVVEIIPDSPVTDFHFPEDLTDFYPKTARDKVETNIAAIRLMKILEAERRKASPSEQELLAKYVGWGGLANDFFDDYNPKFSKEREELKNLVSDKEYSDMKQSSLTAYYTDPALIRQMWDKLERDGFTGGKILDPLSREKQVTYINDKLEQLREIKLGSDSDYTVKEAERSIKGLEHQLEELQKLERDTFIEFENLGIDFLFVDEAHHFKNIRPITGLGNVAGITNTTSKKNVDMEMKVRQVQAEHGDRNVVFATGTPVSNSISELFTMMNYIQPDVLERYQVSNFDSWVGAFGNIENSMELAPTGDKYQPKKRFKKFVNLPELMRIYKETADIQTSDMLDLPVPEAKIIAVESELTQAQKYYLEELVERSDAIKSGSVDPSRDNMLKITGEARKLAIDMRLIDPVYTLSDNQKILQVVDNVERIYLEGAGEKATQMIFSDIGTPKSKEEGFDVYNELKALLVERGIPKEEIAFVHDANTDEKKNSLSRNVNSGEVRILMASTEKGGTGLNVQSRMKAVHHLDVPWRPSDVGRILRTFKIKKNVEVTDNGKDNF
ncbi:SNF2-related protein [Streptococcus sp. A23]|uniref:SNF2-related protein n=1 Tax=Streptococcus sp. A23 TaxID=3373127 RepID=UPI00374CCE65